MPGTKGLEDVVAAATSISDIDGKLGRLFYVGYDIHDLVTHTTFEEVIYLLHNTKLPTRGELDKLTDTLTSERDLDPWVSGLMPTFAT